jgi:N-acetyldiaminopimelate deacetylase
MNPFVKIRRDLHLIPELGFQEYKTQAYLLSYLETLSQERVSIKKWKTGLFVKVHGSNPRKIIGYRADIDGLPIVEETELEFSSTHKEQMHACGHDFHMSISLGVLTHYVENPIQDDLLFIFQPAERDLAAQNPC